MGAAGYGPVPHGEAPGGMTGHAVTVGWDSEAVGTKSTEIVVSGPDHRGHWHWRHLDSTEGFHEVPTEVVDPDWTSGTVVTARVDHRPGGPVILTVGDPSDDEAADVPTILVNGEPFEAPADRDLEPGVVVTARVRFGSRADARDDRSEAKWRPAVVVHVGPLTVSVRGVFSQNTEGRGQRLLDWEEAGLHHGSVIENDETIVALDDVGEVVGRLSDADRRRLGL